MCMEKFKCAVSTQTKVKVVKAIESGIIMQTVADTMQLDTRHGDGFAW